MNARKPFLAEL